MRSTFIIAFFFILPFSKVYAQFSMMDTPGQFGVSVGTNVYDVQYTNLNYYNPDVITDDSETFYYTSAYFKQFLDLGYVGPFAAGLAYNVSFGGGKHKQPVSYFDSTLVSKGFVVLNVGLLGELYFGEADEPSFYVGAGVGFSGLTQRNGGLLLGPQVGVGKQFAIGDELFSCTATMLYGLLKSDNIHYSQATLIKDTKYQIALSFGWFLPSSY